MFVVTDDGVIATDPLSYQNDAVAYAYINAIKAETTKPIKFVVYSHHHADRIGGGKPFQQLGATFVAHKQTYERLKKSNDPKVVLPDEWFDQEKTIELGGKKLKLMHVGRNHTDSMIVMRPNDDLIYAVDFIPIETLPEGTMIDSFIPDWEQSLQKVLDLAPAWKSFIPGRKYTANERLGTPDDVTKLMQYMQELSGKVEAAAKDEKCWEVAMREIKLPTFEKWANYKTDLPLNVERYCYHFAQKK
jgi:glyoxylase-like metal-dependent hydrolase (beta-lactamase superfamily II)